MISRPGLEELKSYSVEEADYAVKLDANERPANLPPAVKAEVLDRLGALDFHRYPDMGIRVLREKIAAAMNMTVDNVLIGNGSSELLEAICYAYGGAGRSIVFPTPSFSMYAIYTKLADSQPVPVKLEADFSLSVPAVLAAVQTSQASLILLCNPNNPTGNTMSLEDIETIVSQVSCPVVVDEAYYEFYGHSAVALLPKYPNLIIARTFSKAYGLAAARVGYLLAAPAITALVGKVLMPYHVNALSLATAEVVYDRRKAFEPEIDNIVSERRRLADSLELLAGLTIYPSQTNFLLIHYSQTKALVTYLSGKGIGIRDFSAAPGLEGCFRITVGTAEENNILLQAITDCLEGLS